MNIRFRTSTLPLDLEFARETHMEELHRIHKDVPYGYWVEWIMPAWRWLNRKSKARAASGAPLDLRRLS